MQTNNLRFVSDAFGRINRRFEKQLQKARLHSNKTASTIKFEALSRKKLTNYSRI